MELDSQMFWISIHRLAIGLFKILIILEILFGGLFDKELAQFDFINGIEASILGH